MVCAIEHSMGYTISVEFSCKIRYALRQKTYVSAPTHDYRRPYDP